MSGPTLPGRGKMKYSPHRIYLSMHHLGIVTHTRTLRHDRTRTHISREPRGQEVCGLIERAHGATVTLNVQGFIRALERRCKS